MYTGKPILSLKRRVMCASGSEADCAAQCADVCQSIMRFVAMEFGTHTYHKVHALISYRFILGQRRRAAAFAEQQSSSPPTFLGAPSLAG